MEGVGVILKEEVMKMHQDCEPINSRIISVNIRLTIGNVTVIQLHAQTEDSNAIEFEQFYSELSTRLETGILS